MKQNLTTVDDALEQHRSRIGVRMTVLYLIVYGGFVAISVFRPTWMGVRALLGLNLAVAYGLGLIIIAIIFALVYNYLCGLPLSTTASRSESSAHSTDGQREE